MGEVMLQDPFTNKNKELTVSLIPFSFFWNYVIIRNGPWFLMAPEHHAFYVCCSACADILCRQPFKQHLIIYAAEVRHTELLWKKVYAHYVIDAVWNMNLLLQNLNHKNIVKYLGSLKTKTHLHIILE